MKNRVLGYLKYLEEVVNSTDEKSIQDAYNDILTQIAFFQHERLIHLIVTVTFAMLAIISLWFYTSTQLIPVLILFLLIMVLLIPYINHYYLLENSVQKMYEYYDILYKKINN